MKARRRAWHGREVALEDESWRRLADRGPAPSESVEETELLRAIATAIQTELTPHQREVFTALALNGVPIDVLAERLDDHARRALQDAPRRAAQAPCRARRRRLRLDDHGPREAGHEH